MSWVDRELKKRTAEHAPGRSAAPPPAAAHAEHARRQRVAAVWVRLEKINNALPDALRLNRVIGEPGTFVGLVPAFPVALVASNGACLGLTEEGVRYLWPTKNARKSNNFWLRWEADKGYVLSRRVSGSWISPSSEEHRFDTTKLEYMIKCLVTCERIDLKAVRASALPWRRG